MKDSRVVGQGGGQGVAPGFSCGVRTFPGVGEGSYFYLSLTVVRHCMAGPGLPGQGRRGNVPTHPLKAQNTALTNLGDSLVSHSRWAFKTRS